MTTKLQFVYFLKLVPRLQTQENWGEAETNIVQRHFERLKGLLAEGRLILAGRTQNDAPTGIVILEVGSEQEAYDLMQSDPAVAEGIMTAELFPYKVALYRG